MCNEKSFFKTYGEFEETNDMMMRNANSAKVLGIGIVELQFTSGRKLIRTKIYHFPGLKNSLICKFFM